MTQLFGTRLRDMKNWAAGATQPQPTQPPQRTEQEELAFMNTLSPEELFYYRQMKNKPQWQNPTGGKVARYRNELNNVSIMHPKNMFNWIAERIKGATQR